MAGSLNHPNIVTVYDFFEEDGTPYIAMEYLERGSLRPLVGSLSVAQTAGVLEGVLAGLAYAAENGIVHRDLKPENLLVTRQGGVKIADLGIAKAYNQVSLGLTATGLAIGTPAYMAPEQAMAREVTPATDLYATGVIAYEMLLGRVPFADTTTPLAILMQHVNQPIPPPRSLRPELDPRLGAWLERMLAKAPEERPADAQSAWHELEEIVVDLLGWRWRQDAKLVDWREVPALPRHAPPEPVEPEPDRAETAQPSLAGIVQAEPGETGGPDSAPTPGPEPSELAAPLAPVDPADLTTLRPSFQPTAPPASRPAKRTRRGILVPAIAGFVVLAIVGVVIAVLAGGGGGTKSAAVKHARPTGPFPSTEPERALVASIPTGLAGRCQRDGAAPLWLLAAAVCSPSYDGADSVIYWKFATRAAMYHSYYGFDAVVQGSGGLCPAPGGAPSEEKTPTGRLACRHAQFTTDIVWTNDAKRILGAVYGYGETPLSALHTWWSSNARV
jgi:hypothetical protein